MNKVVTVNLGGNAYQLEEGGFDVLQAYLETGKARLQGNPDREEILSDIERAIADKFRELLGNFKTVVSSKEVEVVVAELGPIEAGSEDAMPSEGSSPLGKPPAVEEDDSPRRLYRIREGAMIAGVCNGLAAYMHIDPTFVRIAFTVLTLFWGTGLLVYLAMMFLVPEARSSEEKADAVGIPATAQEFIHRAKEGYYEALKGFPDRKARRDWKRKFKQEMRAGAYQWKYPWAEQMPQYPSMSLALPFLSILHGVVTILWICSLISLLATSAVFGLVLPPNVPVWLAALLLIIIYGVLTWPLKMVRRSCYRGVGRTGGAWPLMVLVDIVIWVGVIFVLLWLASHYSSQLHDAIQHIPSLAQQLVSDVRTWWQAR